MGSSGKVESIREQLPAVQRTAFFNTGTSGPLPTAVAEAMAGVARHELVHGRADVTGFLALQEKVAQTRAVPIPALPFPLPDEPIWEVGEE